MKQNKIKLGYQKPQTEIMSINSESFLLDANGRVSVFMLAFFFTFANSVQKLYIVIKAN